MINLTISFIIINYLFLFIYINIVNKLYSLLLNLFLIFFYTLFTSYTVVYLYYNNIFYPYAMAAMRKNRYRKIRTSVNYTSTTTGKKKNKDISFNEWLSGLIDGDGFFILTKKGYSSCEITMDFRDKKALYEIKQKYGGSIKAISNANAVRYKLRHKKGLISLLNDVNGLIRNPIRLLQMNKLCVKYNIRLKYSAPLTFYNGWLSGFIDSDGSIYYNEASGQVFIGISQKNRYLLEPLIHIYGGRIDILSPKIEAFKYVVYRKGELFNLIDNYFSKYPLKTEKMKRVTLIKDFYLFRVDKNSQDIIKYKDWITFKDRWEKYQD